MKRVLIALLTFLLSVFASDLLNFEKLTKPQVFTSVHRVVEIQETQIEDFSNQKIDDSKPFFNSFNEDESFNGWLRVDNFRGMKEVWTILLSRDYENSKNEELVWSAMILTQHSDYSSNEDDNFRSVWIKTENNRLSFRTNKIRGIEYKFDGEFFKYGKEFFDDEKVLKGTLRKIVKGKEIAGFHADFSYYEPVCLH